MSSPEAVAIGLLRAGLTPAEAFRCAGWGPVAADGAPEQCHDAGIRLGARLAHATGAPLAPILESIAARNHASAEARIARDAALAGPRLSARILGWLPAAGVALAAVVDPGALRLLVLTPLGWGLAVMSAGLTLAGRWWMRRLLRSARAAAEPRGPASAVVLVAVAACLSAGMDVRGAIAAVSAALGGPDGAALSSVAVALADGAAWERAWAAAGAWAPLEEALRHAWKRGAHAAPILAAAADEVTLEVREAAQRAGAELAVRLALPLALCLLPAFVVGAIAPLVASLVLSL